MTTFPKPAADTLALSLRTSALPFEGINMVQFRQLFHGVKAFAGGSCELRVAASRTEKRFKGWLQATLPF